MTDGGTIGTPGVSPPGDEARLDYEERFRFESLLTDLSARFINVHADQLDAAIGEAQRQICEFLKVDVCSLWRLSPENPDTMVLVQIYHPPDFPPLALATDASDASPWGLAQMQNGADVVVARVDDTPPEAEQDRALWRRHGVKSLLTLPLSVGGGRAFGALNFCCTRREREWDQHLIDRLRLVGQMFASAVARQDSERKLRESEARLMLATSAADIGLWALDGTGTRFWVNEKISELFGIPRTDEMAVSHFLALVHPEDLELARSGLDGARQSTQLTAIEYRIVRPDGALRWMLSRGRLITGAQDRPWLLMGITVDITERKRSEHEFQQQRQELAHLSRVMTMSELSGSLAHELNQPLAIILTNAEAAQRLLAQEPPDLAEVRDTLADIVSEDQRAGNIIRRLRAMLKPGHTQLEPLSANELVEDVLRIARSDLIGRGITVQTALDARGPLVTGDRIQLQQVLLNLVLNAEEAMAGNAPAQRLLSLATEQRDGLVRISVADTGRGLPSNVESIFEPFYTTKKEGLGLGLPICRSIIASHHGRLWAEARVAKRNGATFCMDLPLLAEGPP